MIHGNYIHRNYGRLPKCSSELNYVCVLEFCLAVKENPYLTVQSLLLSLLDLEQGWADGVSLGLVHGTCSSSRLSQRSGCTGLYRVIRNLPAEDEALVTCF